MKPIDSSSKLSVWYTRATCINNTYFTTCVEVSVKRRQKTASFPPHPKHVQRMLVPGILPPSPSPKKPLTRDLFRLLDLLRVMAHSICGTLSPFAHRPPTSGPNEVNPTSRKAQMQPRERNFWHYSKQLSEGARSSLEEARSDLRRCKIPTPGSSCHIGWPFSLQAAKVQICNQRMRRLAP